MRGNPLVLLEDRDVFLPVDRNRNGLAKKSCAPRLFGGLAASEDGVEPVEAQVPEARLDRFGKAQVLFRVERKLFGTVRHGGEVAEPGVDAVDRGTVVVALKEFRLKRHRLLFDFKDDALDKRQRFAAGCEIPLFLVPGFSFARVGDEAEEGVLHHFVPAVFLKDAHHEGAGADGPGVEREIVLLKAPLRIKLLRLPRNGCEKGHGEPVGKLRVLPLDADAKRVVVERLGPFEGDAVDVEIGVVSFLFPKETVLFAKRAREFLEPHDVVAHGSENRAHDAGTCDAADAVHVVVRGEFARAALGEVAGLPLCLCLFVGKVVVEEVSVPVLREGRVRRKADSLLNRNVVDGNGDRFGGGVDGEFPALRIEVARLHHAHGRAGHERVGALQVVVLIERLVNAVGVGRFVRRVRSLRIERAGTASSEGRKERLFRIFLHVARSVEHDALCGKREAQYGHEKPTDETLQGRILSFSKKG